MYKKKKEYWLHYRMPVSEPQDRFNTGIYERKKNSRDKWGGGQSLENLLYGI